MSYSPLGDFGLHESNVMDYNQEAHNLWARLGIDPKTLGKGGNGRVSKYSNIDLIYRSPEGGAIYVGDSQAAQDLCLLKQLGIAAVVNCTTDIPNYHKPALQYFNFDVTWWKRQVGMFPSVGHEMFSEADMQRKLKDFLRPMLHFVESNICRGRSVLVHCLAGAHRAGTTGTICLLHFGGLSAKRAESTAKSLRPIIQLIGDFPDLVKLCDQLPRGPDGRLLLADYQSGPI